MAALRRRARNLNAIVGASPMIAVAVGVYVIGIAYSVALSFTSSQLFPDFSSFVGLENYARLWSTNRWIVSVQNIWLFGILSISINLLAGFLLAVFLDQRVRQEDAFRTIFLYPFAMSLVVTGLVWQWMLDPNLGLQQTVRNWGWESFSFAPLTNPETAIYGAIVAGIWQGSGVTMAILLAGLRGIDAEIWKASRVDGVPTWKTYLYVVLPMLGGSITTALVLETVRVVRVYDLIVAMTQGGPGIATQMPAVFVIEHITNRQNVALGMAAATMMLLPILVLLAVSWLPGWRRRRRAAGRAA